ncbi:MAG: HAMP domain-containing histidine kinase [Clostridiales bacterium]|nr:HAMP domain-containing histidine kinase [Clostridiales bacterium]
MIKKLQIKFVVINMTIVTILLLVIFGLVYNFTKSNLETESITMMQSIAENPFQLGRPNESSTNLKLPYFALQIGPRGELVATGGGYYELTNKEFLKEMILHSIASSRNIGVVKEYNLRFYRVNSPMGTVLVFSDMSSENATLSNLIRTSLIIGSFSFLAFLGLSIFLSKWAIKPVDMAWKQQKQFVADASHELKTPLTVIITNAEMLQSTDYDEEFKRKFSKSILIMSYQMKNLVEKMLELAKSDDQQSKLPMKALNLSKLMSDTAISFEGLFVEKGLSLVSYIEPDISIHGNEEALKQLIDVLLDNAQKYSNQGGETCIRLYSTSFNRCHLAVSNQGPEISGEDLKKVFTRFYRIDKSRNRDGGFGLGLSIAANIASQHGAKIWAQSKDGINTFFVEFTKKI